MTDFVTVFGALAVGGIIGIMSFVVASRGARALQIAPTETTGTPGPTLMATEPQPITVPVLTPAGLVPVPYAVVQACIGEAGGNSAVLDRALQSAATLVRAGLPEAHVLLAVQAGEREEA